MGEPTAPTDPWAALRDAAADRGSGSSTVAVAAAEALAALADDGDRIAEGAALLVRGQPVMAACLHLADAVLRAADEGAEAAARAARGFVRRLAEERRGLIAALRSFVPTDGTIVTVSASSTVVAALAQGTPAGARVVCSLSEPGGEGRSAAAALAQAEVPVEVIPDAAIAMAASSADLVVFGADAVGPGAALNKVGTLAAVLGGRHGRRLCVAACGTTKLCDQGAWERIRTIGAARTACADGTAPVPLFEPVPLALLFRVITEDGPLTPAATRRLAGRSRLDPRVLATLDEVTA